ncbi:MXAN_5187 C-terminal domain-containing protein [Geomonas sp.]|uniref:MXAN_5187 C-terminal domain-containing protein n=1 Tax=Geomonas sp. TaxID=2651584 RepID=UPI002B45A98B|nr:MXAN_5187 C-terminal domain-containing protein [Geomonas sp.]HJV37075.1 MXAN_5187 C-terminal domain-containing protein [Geomonas sp.]
MAIPEDIARLEQDLRELIIKYEQYFFGIEKREPLRLLDQVERLVRRYQNVTITNTRDRFKYDTLVAALSVHKQKWIRTNRLIEEGKYERDRFRMSLHDKKRTRTPAAQQVDLERVYQQYLTARKACNLPVENVPMEKFVEAVERQKPAIMKKYGAEEVDLVVVIEGGKPRLKARQKLPRSS